MEIRDALLSDLPAIVAIYNETIPDRQATADLEPVSVEEKKAWFLSHKPGKRPLWVALEKGVPVAWLSFHSFYGRAAYEITCEIGLYVSRAYRGKGIGPALLEKALREAPGMGIENLIGFIFAHNVASLALFHSFGFENWGTLPAVARLDEKYADLLIVGKTLR